MCIECHAVVNRLSATHCSNASPSPSQCKYRVILGVFSPNVIVSTVYRNVVVVVSRKSSVWLSRDGPAVVAIREIYERRSVPMIRVVQPELQKATGAYMNQVPTASRGMVFGRDLSGSGDMGSHICPAPRSSLALLSIVLLFAHCTAH